MSAIRTSAYTKVQSLLIRMEYEESKGTLQEAVLDYEDEINLMVVNAFNQSDVEAMSVFLFSVNDPQTSKERYVLIPSYNGSETDAFRVGLEQLNTDGRTDEYEYFMDVLRIKCEVAGFDVHESLV